MENSLFKLLIEPCVKFVMMLTMDITRYATPCFKKSVNYMKWKVQWFKVRSKTDLEPA